MNYSFSWHSFEFRHSNWYNEGTFTLLEKNNIILCIANSPSFPKIEHLTTDFCYIRFHGGKELYSSEYSQSELALWSEKSCQFMEKAPTLLAYFNNDAQGFAVKNARQFREMVCNNIQSLGIRDQD